MKRFRFLKVVKVLVFVIAGLFIFGSIVMLLWNALMPTLFHLPVITFWQALGLLILSKLLFGGFRGGGWQRHPHWKQRMQQRWMNMTPEERERFKQEWARRCGPGARRWFEEQKQADEQKQAGA